MKHLIYFKPDRKLSDLILGDGASVSKLGLHSTLYFFDMGVQHEERLISDLKKISWNPFELITTEFGDFDEESFVLKVSRTKELFDLHKKIMLNVRKYLVGQSAENDRYFGGNYAPHITIPVLPHAVRRDQELLGNGFVVEDFYLAKKEVGWEELKQFKK